MEQEDAVNWSTEHTEQLRALWGRKLSASEIGAIIGCSRHAVIGKAHRIGLPPIERAPARKPPVRGRDRQFPRIRKRGRTPATIAADAELKDIPLTVIGEPRMLSIVDLDSTTCRWPIGDPRTSSFGYCGHPTGPASRYCAGHHAIAYRPAESEDELLTKFADARA
jgi:GcrA cell cycle regulator